MPVVPWESPVSPPSSHHRHSMYILLVNLTFHNYVSPLRVHLRPLLGIVKDRRRPHNGRKRKIGFRFR